MFLSINTLARLSRQTLFLFVLFFISTTLSAFEINKVVDKETNFAAWKVSEGNFELELIQRSPQQTRSFFQARGFSPEIANDIATHCVLQTIVRNTEVENTTDSITVSLEDWHLVSVNNDTKVPIKLKESWDSEWKPSDISTAARIAFRWATFPTEQVYEPGGDFNWGMISFGPKPKERFHLHLLWKQGTKTHSAWIKDLECPADNL